ncbi:MAG: hypothetical protein IKR04_01370 [Clostridia bacterium]|nr:hypothetical protein [Clostridia bacterium]
MTKEIIKTVIVFILLIIAAFVVFTTRGNDKMEWDINFNIETEDTFNYDIVSDSQNGEYKNTKGNRMYALVGKNYDGTYRIYFIHIGSTVGINNKDPKIRIDDAKLDANGSYIFTTENNVSLKLTLKDKNLTVTSNMSLGDSQIEGNYTFQKSISRFALSEVQIYN